MNPKERVLKVYPHTDIAMFGDTNGIVEYRCLNLAGDRSLHHNDIKRRNILATGLTENECWENASKVIGLLPHEKTMLRSAIIKSPGLIDMIKISIKHGNELNLNNAICVLAVRSGLDKDLVRENINEIIEL